MDRKGYVWGSMVCGVALVGLLGLGAVTQAEAVTAVGACCPPLGPCLITDETNCLATLGGAYGGDGTVCSDIVCDQNIEAPVLSIFGLVGLLGGLGGLGIYRIARRPRA